MEASSPFINAIRVAAKQADDEEALLRILQNECIVKSMKPDGDCAFELMCRWKAIVESRQFGRLLPRRVVEENVSPQQISSMRHAVADAEDEQIFDKENKILQNLVKESLFDWSRRPLENAGRNVEVQAAVQSLPPEILEADWMESREAVELHSSLIRTGQHQVFGEAPELEAFSLMTGFPLAIYLPGDCELFPKSVEVESGKEYLLGICNGSHFYLAVPKTWIGEEQSRAAGWLRMLFAFRCHIEQSTQKRG